MTPRRKAAIAFVGALFSLPMEEAWAQQTQKQIVGVVERIEPWSPGAQQAMLQRSDTPERPLVLGEYIHDGDRIRAPHANTTIVIARERGPLTICSRGARSEDCVAVIEGKGSYLQAVAQFVGSLEKIVSWYSATQTANLVTRAGNPPRIRLGAGKPQKIVADEAPLWLGWSGGDAPFKVRIEQAGVSVETRTERREATLARHRLKPGSAEIVIVDERGRSVRWPVQVVAAIPPLPDLASAAPTLAHRQYLSAGWLAMQDDGAYLLEAASRLNAIAASFPAAGALKAGLAAGEKPRS